VAFPRPHSTPPIVNSTLSEEEGVGDSRQSPLARRVAPAIRALLAGLLVVSVDQAGFAYCYQIPQVPWRASSSTLPFEDRAGGSTSMRTATSTSRTEASRSEKASSATGLPIRRMGRATPKSMAVRM